MKKLVIAALVLAALTGCASNRNVRIDVPFDEAAARKMLAPGANAILGSGLIRKGGGGIVTCAGNGVALIPNTAYARAWMSEVYASESGGYKPKPSKGIVFEGAEKFYAAQKEGRCDALGAFAFDDVADGEFYVYTTVTWIVPTGYGPIPQGGSMATLIKTSAGKTTKVVLSP